MTLVEFIKSFKVVRVDNPIGNEHYRIGFGRNQFRRYFRIDFGRVGYRIVRNQ